MGILLRAENEVIGTVVTTVTAVDPDGVAPPQYFVGDGDGLGSFSIDANGTCVNTVG